MNFLVLDTEPMAESTHHVPIILGRPFLATTNAVINCRNGVMQLTFGNMTLELNIFHLSNRDKPAEDKEQKSKEVCLSGTSEGKASIHKLQEELIENQEAVDEGSTASVSLPASVVTPQTRGSVDYPSTRGNTRECRVTRHFSRKSGRVSFVWGALPKYKTCIYMSQTVQ